MPSLEMTCNRCLVAQTCPKSGSSPLFFSSGKRAHCRILGGYGRQPVDEAILSAESLVRSKKDGPCLTLAEVPVLDDGMVTWEITKVFSPPIVNERERPTAILGGQLNPKNPGT
jgi:hypothetical protein